MSCIVIPIRERRKVLRTSETIFCYGLFIVECVWLNGKKLRRRKMRHCIQGSKDNCRLRC